MTSPALLVSAVAFVILLAIWLGYPLVIGLWRRRYPASAVTRTVGALPSVSVVVATRENPVILQRRVANLLDASRMVPTLEVIIAADHCCDQATVVGYQIDDPRVKVVQGDAPGGKAAALNAGVRAATGDILVFADSQQTFDDGAVAILAEQLVAGPFAAVSGRLLLPGDTGQAEGPIRRYWAIESRLREQESQIHSAIGVTGCIWALWRERWEPLPVGILNDDVFAPMRLVLQGHRVGYAGRAIARDLRQPDERVEYRRKVRTLAGNIQVCRALPALLLPHRNPVWFQFVMHKLARYLTPLLTLVIGVSMMQWALSLGLGWQTYLGALLLSAALVAGVPLVRRRVAWLWHMQLAIVVGTYRGLRGSWDVWSPR